MLSDQSPPTGMCVGSAHAHTQWYRISDGYVCSGKGSWSCRSVSVCNSLEAHGVDYALLVEFFFCQIYAGGMIVPPSVPGSHSPVYSCFVQQRHVVGFCRWSQAKYTTIIVIVDKTLPASVLSSVMPKLEVYWRTITKTCYSILWVSRGHQISYIVNYAFQLLGIFAQLVLLEVSIARAYAKIDTHIKDAHTLHKLIILPVQNNRARFKQLLTNGKNCQMQLL